MRWFESGNEQQIWCVLRFYVLDKFRFPFSLGKPASFLVRFYVRFPSFLKTCLYAQKIETKDLLN
jgi:hypothetical protein